MDTEVFDFYTIVTLNQSQGHPYWYQSAELSGPYHHTKLERNWSVNLWIQANVKILKQNHKQGFLWKPNGRLQMSTKFITSTILNSTPNSIQIDRNLYEIIAAEVFAFLHSCGLDSKSRSITLVPKCRVHLSSDQVWSKLIHKRLNAYPHLSFLMQPVKQQLFLVSLYSRGRL